MSLSPLSDGRQAVAGRSLYAPIGAISPLWWGFAASTTAGVAYWMMTRWTRPFHLEAMAAALAPMTLAAPEAVIAAAAKAEAEFAEPDLAEAPQIVEAAQAYEQNPEAIAELAEPAPQPQPTLEAAAEPAAAVEPVADDLTKLVGIGPKLAVALADRGVTRFADIAAWGEGELERFDRELALKGRAVRDAWVGQARRFAEQSAALH